MITARAIGDLSTINHLQTCPILFIAGARRSGTTWLFETLAGNPNFLKLPEESTFLTNVLNAPPDQEHVFAKESIFSLPYNEAGFRGIQKAGGRSTFIQGPDYYVCKDPDQFKAFYEDAYNPSLPLIERIIRALAIGHFGSDSKLRKQLSHKPQAIVCKLPDVIERLAQNISLSFGSCRFIHLMRDPRDRFLSDKVAHIQNFRKGLPLPVVRVPKHSDLILWFCRSSFRSQALALQNRDHIEKYRILFYEEFKKNPQQMLQNTLESLDFEVGPTRVSERSNSSYLSHKNKLTSGKERWEYFTTHAERQVLEYVCQLGNQFSNYQFSQIEKTKLRDLWKRRYKFEFLPNFFLRRIHKSLFSLSENELISYLRLP